MKNNKHTRGFSLIEVLISIFLVAVAVLGLAELFLAAVANNLKADRVANATFLAQQEIDWLRGLTRDELDVYRTSSAGVRDEILDLNGDGTNDFRRITVTSEANDLFNVTVHVYSAENIGSLTPTELLNDPEHHRPRALISTLIGR